MRVILLSVLTAFIILIAGMSLAGPYVSDGNLAVSVGRLARQEHGKLQNDLRVLYNHLCLHARIVPDADLVVTNDALLSAHARIISYTSEHPIFGLAFDWHEHPGRLSFLQTMMERRNIRQERNLWKNVFKIDHNWLPAVLAGSTAIVSGSKLYIAQALELTCLWPALASNALTSTSCAFTLDNPTPDVLIAKVRSEKTRRRSEPFIYGLLRRIECGLLVHAGRELEALKLYEEIDTSSRTLTGASYCVMAMLKDKLGLTDEVNDALRRGLARFPSDSALLIATATRCLACGDQKAAESNALKCLQASPGFPPAHALLAEMHVAAGELDEAIVDCDNLVRFSYGWPADCRAVIQSVIEAVWNARKDQ